MSFAGKWINQEVTMLNEIKRLRKTGTNKEGDREGEQG
jgi:hypothetical protein